MLPTCADRVKVKVKAMVMMREGLRSYSACTRTSVVLDKFRHLNAVRGMPRFSGQVVLVAHVHNGVKVSVKVKVRGNI